MERLLVTMSEYTIRFRELQADSFKFTVEKFLDAYVAQVVRHGTNIHAWYRGSIVYSLIGVWDSNLRASSHRRRFHKEVIYYALRSVAHKDLVKRFGQNYTKDDTYNFFCWNRGNIVYPKGMVPKTRYEF